MSDSSSVTVRETSTSPVYQPFWPPGLAGSSAAWMVGAVVSWVSTTSARLWNQPAEIASTSVRLGGTLVWPYELSPQATTVPEVCAVWASAAPGPTPLTTKSAAESAATSATPTSAIRFVPATPRTDDLCHHSGPRSFLSTFRILECTLRGAVSRGHEAGVPISWEECPSASWRRGVAFAPVLPAR